MAWSGIATDQTRLRKSAHHPAYPRAMTSRRMCVLRQRKNQISRTAIESDNLKHTTRKLIDAHAAMIIATASPEQSE
jgi:hypothetical protein